MEEQAEETAPRKRGRKKQYENDAARQAAYRERTKILRDPLGVLKEHLTAATERSRCSKLMDHLPDEPTKWVAIVGERLRDKMLIVASAPTEGCPRKRRKRRAIPANVVPLQFPRELDPEEAQALRLILHERLGVPAAGLPRTKAERDRLRALGEGLLGQGKAAAG